MTRALELHKLGQTTVVLLTIRTCDLEDAPFEEIEELPKDMKAVTDWRDRDAAWTNTAQGIRKVARSFGSR